ncbi:hypothetical protein TcWFU_002264 [Taenia crassiceps]|uniref:Death domain-containing protein n=1 Tax=Taenia crassiceps TaxID=6207 RepID=A0ABR4QJJ2_9CEST
MPPRSQQSESRLGFYQMRTGAQADTNGLAANWFSFSEKGISHDLNGTLDSMNIKTAFRVDEPKSMQSQGKCTDDQLTSQLAYGDDYPMITIYCSLLGLVILTLLIYVFYKLWQQRLSAEDAKAIETDVCYPAFTGLKAGGGKLRTSKMSVPSKDTTDRQHLLGGSQQYSYAPQYPTIHDALLTELSQGLAVENRWKHVGGLLGFSEESLQNFEKVGASDETSNSVDSAVFATRLMLTSWYSTRAATDPNPLMSLLMVLERTPSTGHLCRCLKEYIKHSSTSPYYVMSPTQPPSQLPTTAIPPEAQNTSNH